jgi:nitrate reductase assembly molybdenum cofactor insertion protein NarJ
MNLDHYARISLLFDYPSESYYKILAGVKDELGEKYSDALKELGEFEKLIPKNIYKLQEIFTKSFEVQAVTSLEIGYLLYGDDYTRGDVMVGLNQEHRAVNNDCGEELSDHLANVLRLVSKMKNQKTIEELVTLMVAPAVENMMKEFTPSSIEQKDELYKKQYKTLIVPSVPLGMFLHLIKALYLVLDKDFALIQENKPFGDTSFFGFLKSELEVEEGKKSSNTGCGPTFNVDGTMGSSCSTC